MWKKLKQQLGQWQSVHQLWKWRGVWITAPSVTVLALALQFAGLLQPLELWQLDLFFRLRPLEPPDDRIVIVAINESDIRQVGKWPIPDAVMATLLNKIKQQQPRAIGLDVYRDLPVDPGNPELVKVFESTPNLIGIQYYLGKNNPSSVAPPLVLKKLDQVGVNNMPLDPDGSIRRGLLYLTPTDADPIPSLALKLSLIYLKQQGITEQEAAVNRDYLQLGKAVFIPFESNDGAYVRADAGGYQILFNYRGPRGTFRSIPLTDVLEDKVPTDLMRDRIVLIGTTAVSLNDSFFTPYGKGLIGSSQRTPGVEIHANLVSQILSSALDERPLIHPWSKLAGGLWIFGWALFSATLTWASRYKSGVNFFSPWRFATIIFASTCVIGISYTAFLAGLWIPVVPPLLALAGCEIAITVYIAVTATYIRQTFCRYLTDEVVANLLETPEGLKLGGDRQKVTIIMSDIRGFSAVSERLPPEKVVAFLNIFLGIMADEITKYNGTIDEFIGDAILVIFGAPTLREDDAQRAIACAVAMQLAMEKVNQQIMQLDMPKLEMGIGINTGEVVVGNIGSQKRAKYGVVGSHVNITGRIESYTVGGQILISEYTLEDAGPIVKINGEMQVSAKGIKKPITLYDIGGIYGKYNLFMPETKDSFYLLPLALSLKYTVLDGKHVLGDVFEGSLVKLSDKGGELCSELPLEPLNNLKINLLRAPGGPESGGDLYAKVVRKVKGSNNSYYLRFTSTPPDVAQVFHTLLDNISQVH